MAKAKRNTQDDLNKFFAKAKKNLQRLGKETRVWMKKGETELSRLSKIGRLEIDVVTLRMEKEKLFKDIGKRVVERGLAEEINDSTVKGMSGKVNAIVKESKKKKAEISKIGKGILKKSSTRTKKKR